MKRDPRVWLLLALLAFPTAGCRMADKFKVESVPKPKAEVTAVRLTEHTGEGMRIEITVELTSKCEVPLPLVAADYTLSLGGKRPVAFSNTPNRTLPAGGTQTVTLPAVVAVAQAGSGDSVEGIGAAGAPVTIAGSITYEPPGEIRLLMTESKVPLPSVSFRYSGQLQ